MPEGKGFHILMHSLDAFADNAKFLAVLLKSPFPYDPFKTFECSN